MSKRLVLAIALAAASACHHDTPAATAAEVPPLPPASGTPIGYLLDDTATLKLEDDQRLKLTQIDHDLAASLEEIDTQLRAANKQVAATDAPPPQPMGRHGGGRHGGGGGGNGGSGGRHRGSGGGSGARSSDIDRLTEARAADVRDALQRAFAVLDDGQRAAATKLLDDHGVDLDAGRPTDAPKPADSADPPPEP